LPSTHSGSAPRIAVPHRGVVAVISLVFAALFLLLYAVLNHTEDHSFNAHATPPTTVEVTAGQTYEISTPGGVVGLQHRGVSLSGLTCTYTQAGGTAQQLKISALGADTRTTHAVATFVSPVSGPIHIECPALINGAFVDDSVHGSADPAGLFLLLATIALAVAVALGMSFLYRRSSDTSGAVVLRAAEGASEPDEL
jgi:hypothetical protein